MPAEGVISKVDPDKRLVFGWAYSTHDKTGAVAVDKSGDFMNSVDEIEKAAYQYMLTSRAGDADHTNIKTSDVVQTVVFTPEKVAKMGLPPNVLPSGWWLGSRCPTTRRGRG